MDDFIYLFSSTFYLKKEEVKEIIDQNPENYLKNLSKHFKLKLSKVDRFFKEYLKTASYDFSVGYQGKNFPILEILDQIKIGDIVVIENRDQAYFILKHLASKSSRELVPSYYGEPTHLFIGCR